MRFNSDDKSLAERDRKRKRPESGSLDGRQLLVWSASGLGERRRG